MTDILARWKGEGLDYNRKEREAERCWVWVLNQIRISDVLAESDCVRSLASHWGRFSCELNPHTFLLKDIEEFAAAFEQYLAEKKKSFLKDDILAFVAWKVWEAKIQCRNVFAPEMNGVTVEWQQGRVRYAGLFEAFHHALKGVRKELVDSLCEKLHPQYSVESEKGKLLREKLKKDCQELLQVESQEIFDAVIKNNLSALPEVRRQQQLGSSEDAA